MADTPINSPLHHVITWYHAEFGRSVSNDTSVYTEIHRQNWTSRVLFLKTREPKFLVPLVTGIFFQLNITPQLYEAEYHRPQRGMI